MQCPYPRSHGCRDLPVNCDTGQCGSCIAELISRQSECADP